MLVRPLALFRINTHVLVLGLIGCTGDALAYWPGHPTHTLATREAGRGRRRVRSHTGVADGVAYELLRELFHNGTITPLTAASACVVWRPMDGLAGLPRQS